jgi:hypothetical protein
MRAMNSSSIIALMMEAASVSETSVNFYTFKPLRRNNPEDSHLHTSLFVTSQNFCCFISANLS